MIEKMKISLQSVFQKRYNYYYYRYYYRYYYSIPLFDFEYSKLDFAKFAYDHTYDLGKLLQGK